MYLILQWLHVDHIPVFTLSWDHDGKLPGLDAGSVENKQLCGLDSATQHPKQPFIFWTDFTKPVPAENATYCDAPHTSHSEPDRIIMSHTTQNINLMPDASVYIRVFSSAFISGDFSHALKNGPPRPILYWKVGHQSRFTIKKYAII